MDERDYVILRTYSTVWNVESKIYSIENIKLLVPVKPSEVLYLGISFGITMVILKILPFLNGIPFVVKWFIIPYGLMKFLTKQKLDGKLAHKFFIDYLIFKLGPKKFSKFSSVEEHKKIKFTTLTAKRDKKIINKTSEALRENKKSFFSFFKKKDSNIKNKESKKRRKKRSKKFEKGLKMRES